MQKNGTKNQTGENKLLVRGFKIQTLVKRSEEQGEGRGTLQGQQR